MSHHFNFEQLFHYDTKESGITVSIILCSLGQEETFDVKIKQVQVFAYLSAYMARILGLRLKTDGNAQSARLRGHLMHLVIL